MEALAFLIPAALFLGLLGLAAFLWSLRAGQYDDLDGAAHRILTVGGIVHLVPMEHEDVHEAGTNGLFVFDNEYAGLALHGVVKRSS